MGRRSRGQQIQSGLQTAINGLNNFGNAFVQFDKLKAQQAFKEVQLEGQRLKTEVVKNQLGFQELGQLGNQYTQIQTSNSIAAGNEWIKTEKAQVRINRIAERTGLGADEVILNIKNQAMRFTTMKEAFRTFLETNAAAVTKQGNSALGEQLRATAKALDTVKSSAELSKFRVSVSPAVQSALDFVGDARKVKVEGQISESKEAGKIRARKAAGLPASGAAKTTSSVLNFEFLKKERDKKAKTDPSSRLGKMTDDQLIQIAFKPKSNQVEQLLRSLGIDPAKFLSGKGPGTKPSIQDVVTGKD